MSFLLFFFLYESLDKIQSPVILLSKRNETLLLDGALIDGWYIEFLAP